MHFNYSLVQNRKPCQIFLINSCLFLISREHSWYNNHGSFINQYYPCICVLLVKKVIQLWSYIIILQTSKRGEEMDCKVAPYYKTPISLQKGWPYKWETSVLRKRWYNCEAISPLSYRPPKGGGRRKWTVK